jgi:hypothetical protein
MIMSKNTILTMIAAVAGCGIISIIAYYVIRSMKGSIKLFLQHTAFNPGETITGNFDLNVKRPIRGNKLTASLIGVQTTTSRRNGKTETHSHEIYRNEQLIEEAKEYSAGYSAKHEFRIAIPNTGAPEFMNSALGQVLNAASFLLNDRRTELKWKVEARLDAKGVDLAASTRVSINIT